MALNDTDLLLVQNNSSTEKITSLLNSRNKPC